MAVSYDKARKLLGRLDTVWEHTEPTSQMKTAIIGVLSKAVYSKIANTKTLELTIYSMDNNQYVWEGSQCRVVREGGRTVGTRSDTTEEEEDATEADSSESTS